MSTQITTINHATAARTLDIAFFGSSLLSAYWNGAATYYRGIVRALHEAGHRVTFYEPDALDRKNHRDIDPPDWAEVVCYPADNEQHVRDMAKRAADGADVIVKASGVGVHDALLEREVLQHRARGQAAVFWDVDAPATLGSVHADPDSPFRELIPEYDAVLTYGGAEPVVSAYTALGAKRCVPIYNAVDPSTHHAVAPEPRFACDMVFLGNRLPDREARVHEFFLKTAASLPSRSFLLGGSGWEPRGLPINVRPLGHVSTRDHNALNCSARAVLNISRQDMATFGFSPATRVFEAAGAGACLITDAWEGIELFLEPGREILVAHDGDQVSDILASLTATQAARIGAAARRRVLAEHTYTHRATLVTEVLASLEPLRR